MADNVELDATDPSTIAEPTPITTLSEYNIDAPGAMYNN
jgi:hypothetical protein